MSSGLKARMVKHRVFLVEKQPILLHGITRLINGQPDLEVCGDCEEGATAFANIEAINPDVMIVDLPLKRSASCTLIKSLVELDPKLAILVLASDEDALYTVQCLQAGAVGLVMKKEPMESILLAIRRILEGQVYLSNSLKAKLVRAMAGSRKADVSSGSRNHDESAVWGLFRQGLGTGQSSTP